jgi:hypothetical protein
MFNLRCGAAYFDMKSLEFDDGVFVHTLSELSTFDRSDTVEYNSEDLRLIRTC